MLTSVSKKLDALDERILEDQRMVKAIESWTSCMAQEGYRYTDPEEIDGDLQKRFEAIVGVGVRPGATSPPDPGTSYDRAALADLQREEVKIGNADLKCEKQEITPVENKVAAAVRDGVPAAEPRPVVAGEAGRRVSARALANRHFPLTREL